MVGPGDEAAAVGAVGDAEAQAQAVVLLSSAADGERIHSIIVAACLFL